MKNQKGATLLEMLTAVGIMTIIITAFVISGQKGITASFLSNKQGQAAINYHNALEHIISDIRSSYNNGITFPKEACDTHGKNCSEIMLKVPIADGNPPTQYTSDGKIKYGADGNQDCFYRYRVDSSTRQLIRETVCNDPMCTSIACNSDPACNPEAGETATNCPGQCPAGCGDEICVDPPETCANCPSDCEICCPNGYCGNGETCQTCSADCGLCTNVTPPTVCGNIPTPICEPGETCLTCPGDCGACAPLPVCPNGIPEAGENCSNCYADLGAGVCCGNGTKEASETCTSCPADVPVSCGDGCCYAGENCAADLCGMYCGNFVCDTAIGEACGSCSDCSPCCGDGSCNGGETSATCPGDCPPPPPPCTVCGKGDTCLNCQACCGGGVG